MGPYQQAMDEVVKTLGLSLNAYQNLARKTRLPTADATYCLLNLGAEAGELLGLFAKARRKQTAVNRDLAKKELGDILWQVAAVADDLGLSLSDIAQDNLDKLSDRATRGVLDGSGDLR